MDAAYYQQSPFVWPNFVPFIWTKFETLINQIVPQWRKRFYHDSADGLYSGVSLLLAFNAVSIPFSVISAALGTCVLYPYVHTTLNQLQFN